MKRHIGEEIDKLTSAALASVDLQKAEIAALEAKIAEISATVERLAELPKKTRHPAMIPFGETAFFPGNLIHTNECMIRLGEEEFVEQSAFEAAQLLGRRQEKLAAEVEAAKACLKELTDKMQSLRSGLLKEVEGEGQVLDITEEYKEEVHGPLRSNPAPSSAAKGSKPPELTTEIKALPPLESRGRGSGIQDSRTDEIFARLAEQEAAEEAAEAAALGPSKTRQLMAANERGDAGAGPYEASASTPPTVAPAVLKNYPLKKGFFNKPPAKAKKPPLSPPPAATPTLQPPPAVLMDVHERPVSGPAKRDSSGLAAPSGSSAAAAQRDPPASRAGDPPKRVSKFKQQRAGMH